MNRPTLPVALGCTLLLPAFLTLPLGVAVAAATPATPAITAPTTGDALHVGISTVGNTLTFTPSRGVSTIRVQVTSARGAQLYNSGWMTGFDAGLDALSWQALDDKGAPLPVGLYLTLVEIRSGDGTTQTESGSLQLDAAPVTTRSDVTPRSTTITGAGTPNRVVLWLTASTVGDSIITQTSSSALSVAGSLTVTGAITTKAVNATNNSGNALVGNSKSGTALAGITQTGNGVLGTSTSSNGMRGVTGTGIGVRGDSNNGTFGVQGNSNAASSNNSVPVGVDGNANGGATSIGVRGTSSTGTGVSGSSDSTNFLAAAVIGTITSSAPGGGSAGVRGVNNGTSGLGMGVYGTQNGSGYGVYGMTPAGQGVFGESTSGTGVGGTSSTGTAVSGTSGSGTAISGTSSSTLDNAAAIIGTLTSTAPSSSSAGVRGVNNGTGSSGYGVYGSQAGSGKGVYGYAPSGAGVHGESDSGNAVEGYSNSRYGVYGQSYSGSAVSGSSSNGIGVYGFSSKNYAGYFQGNVNITGNLSVGGTLSKGGGSFRIDDPLDPANKYLYHSFVESPDMMNLYNGNVTTDAKGYARVTMPQYFSALNRDFRYQLTVVGTFAQAIVSQKITGNSFVIRTNKSNVEVSWMVTGVRRDPWANDHRIPTQQLKTGAERGRYLYPAGYHKPTNLGIDHLVAEPQFPQGVQQVTATPVVKHAAPPRVAQARG